MQLGVDLAGEICSARRLRTSRSRGHRPGKPSGAERHGWGNEGDAQLVKPVEKAELYRLLNVKLRAES